MTPPKRTRLCPVCRRRPLAPGQRFCSDRCQTVDLGRWLSGDYAIPAEQVPDEDQGEDGQA